MAYWMAGATVGSALLGYMGQKNTNNTAQQIANTPSTQASQGQSSFIPNQMANPLYSAIGGIGGQMSGTPTPFWPGQGYVSPSAPTQAGVNMGMGAMPMYQGAADMGGMANQLYRNAAMGGQGLMDAYQRAAQIGGAGLPLYQRGGSQALGAQRGQNYLLGQANPNYSFLSTAADVANNPYVQGQLSANERSVSKNFMEQMLPQVNQGAAAVNQLGSSRHGLMQGQALGDAAEALANTNASTMLGAYGQGLGAQQNALGQTGAMLQNQMAPALATGWAANQGNLAMQQAGSMADYLRQGMGVQGDAAQYGLNAARAGMEGAGAMNQAANALGMGGRAFGAAGDMFNLGGQTGMGYGRAVEGYQNAALQDAMSRFTHQYQEPWSRAGMIGNLLPMLQPLGVQNSSSTGAQSGPTAALGAVQSPWTAALGGAMGGGLLGYDLQRYFSGLGTPAPIGTSYGAHAGSLGATNYG